MTADKAISPPPNPFIWVEESPFQEGEDEAADAFAKAAIFTICSTGVSASQGRRAYGRCLAALGAGGTARMGFRHPSKADAIDALWRDRVSHYRRYQAAADKIRALEALPWIGPATVRRLALALDLFEAGERRSRNQTGVVTHAF